MARFIQDTSSDEFLTALETNMTSFWSPYGRAEGRTWHATPDVVWFYTGIQVPLFNGVLEARLTPDGVSDTLDSLQAKIDELGAPALWWVGPTSRPDNLGPLLEGHGLQPAGEVPGMAVDLALVDHKPEATADLAVRRVSSADMQAQWARTAAVGTGFPDLAVDAMVQIEATLTGPQYKAQHRYIGFLNGTPVATSAMVLDSGVAGIYAVATLPEARRKGIGSMMTIVPLLQARQVGYRVGVLQASSMGYPIYKRIGFQEVCKYRLYLQSRDARG